MTRIHYEIVRKIYEKREGRKFTPAELIGLNYELALYHATQAIDAGAEPRDHLGFNFASALVAFGESGRQCFELGPKLTAMFQDADLGNVRGDHLRMPYEAFWITIPQGTLAMWGGQRTGFHDLFGMYVHQDASGHLAIMGYCGPNERSVVDEDDSISWITIHVDRMIETEQDFETYMDNLLCDRGGYLPDLFQDGCEVPIANKDALKKHMEDSLRIMTRLAVNTILYLASAKKELDVDQDRKVDADAVDVLCRKAHKFKPSKAKKLATKVSKKKYARLTRLAPSIEKQHTEHKERAGCWVRGHWQIYWTGPGRKIPTPVFKLPFFSGTTQHKDSVREYAVEEE